MSAHVIHDCQLGSIFCLKIHLIMVTVSELAFLSVNIDLDYTGVEDTLYSKAILW